MKKIENYLVNIYIISMFTFAFPKFSKMSLIILSLVSLYFGIKGVIKINLEKKINKTVLLILSTFIFSFLNNFLSLKQILYYGGNVVTILSVFYLAKYYNKTYEKKIEKGILGFTIIYLLIYMILPPDEFGVKKIYIFSIPRNDLRLLPLTMPAIIAVFSFFTSFKLKGLWKVCFIIASLILIYKTGKFSAIFSVIYGGIVFFCLKFFKKKRRLCYILSTFFYVIFSNIHFLVYYLKKEIYGEKIMPLLALRDILWEFFIDYFYASKKIFFGAGFIEDNVSILNLINPHNQYLSIYLILGIYGSIVYLYLFLKVLKMAMENFEEDSISLIYISILYVMFFSESYYLLTVYPLYLSFIFIVLFKNKHEGNNNLLRKERRINVQNV